MNFLVFTVIILIIYIIIAISIYYIYYDIHDIHDIPHPILGGNGILPNLSAIWTDKDKKNIKPSIIKSFGYHAKDSPVDANFSQSVDRIIKESDIGFPLYSTSLEDATIIIELLPRDEMVKLATSKPEYYPGTKNRIWFSWTFKRSKPLIQIDGNNWLYGVKESGLTLDQYRNYVIIHELMHAIGYDHQPCNSKTAPDGICPIMYQSTRGCPKGFKCGYKTKTVDYYKNL